MACPCETRTSTCRSFATISSDLYRFLAITVLLGVKDIPQVGPLQWGRITMVHSDNRLASIIAMGIFATGIAASMLLILAHDRPFTGEISIRPDPLLQVMPEIGT